MNTKIKTWLLAALFLAPAVSTAQEQPAPAQPAPEEPKQELPILLEWDNKEAIYDLSYSPKAGVAVKTKSRVPNGSQVKKGDILVEADTAALESAITDASNERDSAILAVDNARYALEQGEKGIKDRLEKAGDKLKRLEEDFDDYNKSIFPDKVKAAERALKKAEFNVDYRKENLRQLERMYKEDQITEESEEIILTRTRNELVDAEMALETAKINREIAITRQLPREKQNWEIAVKDAKNALEALLPKTVLEKRGLEIALKTAEKKQADAQKKWENLQADLDKTKIAAPADGTLFWCSPGKNSGLDAAFILIPEGKSLVAKKIQGPDFKAGDKIEPYKVELPDSIIYLPEGKVTSVDGDKITITFEE